MTERILQEDDSLLLQEDDSAILRDYPAVRLAPSTHIAAGAATATTQRLTGLTGTFTAGRVSDDTNPVPSVDIGADGNSEFEFNVTLAYDLPNAEVYEFRLTASGAPLNTYPPQAPRVTVNTGVPPPTSSLPLVQSLLQRIPALLRR